VATDAARRSLKLGGTRATSRRDCAIDLGTARIRVLIPDHGVVLDEPSFLAYDQKGAVVGAGQEAWVGALQGAGTLRMPVRGGVVVDPIACVQMLHRLFNSAGLESSRTSNVVVGIPETARESDVLLATGVVAAATGAQVRPVPAMVAAARCQWRMEERGADPGV
jgi:rod shape-determining protein MreB and related proteins